MGLYLVTGATGFIGRALCHQLQASGHRVRALLHHNAAGPWSESHTLELRHDPLPRSLMDGVEGIFHCAGAAHFRSLSTVARTALWQLNVEATAKLIAAAASAGVPRLVYFSSVQAAGSPGDQSVDEDWQSPPDNLYGESKLAAEALVRRAWGTKIRHTVILRPCLVYGPGVKGNLRRMMQAISRGRMPALPKVRNQRSMVALGNLIAAAQLAMDTESAAGRLYIVCDEQAYSSHEIYAAMHQALGCSPPGFALPLSWFRWAARLGDIGNRLSDNAMPWDSAAYDRLFGSAVYSAARLKRELGWQPQQDFFSCLPQIVAELNSGRESGQAS